MWLSTPSILPVFPAAQARSAPGAAGLDHERRASGRYARVRALRARAISRSASRLAMDWRLS
jgi:hypothetical protein